MDLSVSGQGQVKALVNAVINLWIPYNEGNVLDWMKTC
jgi:hypothetical protein